MVRGGILDKIREARDKVGHGGEREGGLLLFLQRGGGFWIEYGSWRERRKGFAFCESR